jgi:hypothetical protein
VYLLFGALALGIVLDVVALALGAGTAAGVGAVLLAIFVWVIGSRQIETATRWMKGANAELAVGEALNELRREGFVVMHDIEQHGEGNIDHLVSGPNGIYLIETKFKSYRPEQLVKAKRQAARLGRELGVWVTPVIVLPKRSGKPYQHDRVWIVKGTTSLASWISTQRNTAVDFERLARFADSLG